MFFELLIYPEKCISLPMKIALMGFADILDSAFSLF